MTTETAPKITIPPLLSVKSSSVAQVGHADGALFVRFKGGKLYRYPGVSADAYAELGKAESIGKHLAALLFNKQQGIVVPEASGV